MASDVCVMYVYIYRYIERVCVCIYIYIYIEREVLKFVCLVCFGMSCMELSAWLD